MCCGAGAYVAPIDPRTGLAMTDAVWQKYMADFMVRVRAEIPGIEIVHNVLWPVPDTSVDVQRELNSADYLELERGFNDFARADVERHAPDRGDVLGVGGEADAEVTHLE